MPVDIKVGAALKQPLGSIRDELHQHIARKDEERPPWNLHASDITKEAGFCPRYPILMRDYKITLPVRNVTTSQAVTWDWGRMVEARTIDLLAQRGLAFGDWVCDHFGCAKVYEWRTRPEQCVRCHGKRFRYLEPRAKSEYSGASSGLDVLLKWPQRPMLTFVEIKSIDPVAFKELLAPLAEHRARTLLSLRNIAESADPRMKQVDNMTAFTFYVSKGGYGVKTPIEGGFTPFKEYQVHRNDAAIEHYAAASRAAYLALKGEGPMPPRFCKHYTDSKAQRCPAMGKCFAAEMPK